MTSLPIVAAIVTSRLGVLVARRLDRKPPWTFIAGEIEPGEDAAEAAVREVKEETGLRIRAAGYGQIISQMTILDTLLSIEEKLGRLTSPTPLIPSVLGLLWAVLRAMAPVGGSLLIGEGGLDAVWDSWACAIWRMARVRAVPPRSRAHRASAAV